MVPFKHLIFCHPLLLLPLIFPGIKVFSNESALHIRLSKYWIFSFGISLSQNQCVFQWASSSRQVAKVLEFQLQHQSFQWIFRTDLLQDGLVGSPCSPRDSQKSSPTPQFKSINSSALSFLHSPTVKILSITLLACEMSAIVWQFEHSLALPFFGIWMRTDHFQSCNHCWVFQICWHIECSTFTASYFRIWNSSTGIPR